LKNRLLGKATGLKLTKELKSKTYGKFLLTVFHDKKD